MQGGFWVCWLVLHGAIVEVNGARVALGGILGREGKNINAKSPSGKQGGSRTDLPQFDLSFLLIFAFWKKDTQFPL